jgi:hypothetical protein
MKTETSVHHSNALLDAIKSHDLSALDAILESGCVDLNTFDPSIWVFATEPGNLKAFQRLLKAGANINTIDRKNANCLHYAVFGDNPDVVQHLVEAGANLEARTSYDETPLQLAVRRKGSCAHQVAMALIEAGAVADNDTLCRAAGLGMSMIRFLLNRNVNVRELRGSKHVRLVDCRGRTALQSLLQIESSSVRLIIAMFALVGVDADKECAVVPPTADELAIARRWLGDAQFDLIVSKRAFQVCLGLQPLWLPALVTCEILMAALGATAPWVQFHNWWNLATRVKHFKKKKERFVAFS